MSRAVWARGPCQVGNCCVEGARGGGGCGVWLRWEDCCDEGRVSGDVISGASARGGYEGRT